MDYKSTLNMPKSGFPMRAGLPKREPEMLKHWEEMDLYNLMLKKNEGKPRFACTMALRSPTADCTWVTRSTSP